MHVFDSKSSHNRNISLTHQCTQLWPCTGCTPVTWHIYQSDLRLSWCIEPKSSDTWMTDVMITSVLSYKEELQIDLLRFASNISHNEHQTTSWKMKAHYHSFNLWSSSEFCLRGYVEVKGEVQFHFFFSLQIWEGLFLTFVQMQFFLFLHKTHLDTFKVQKKLDNHVSAFICQEQFQQTLQSRVTPY